MRFEFYFPFSLLHSPSSSFANHWNHFLAFFRLHRRTTRVVESVYQDQVESNVLLGQRDTAIFHHHRHRLQSERPIEGSWNSTLNFLPIHPLIADRVELNSKFSEQRAATTTRAEFVLLKTRKKGKKKLAKVNMNLTLRWKTLSELTMRSWKCD